MLRPLKQCKKCSALTRNVGGYCNEHIKDKSDTTKQYDKSRDDKYVKFYNSSQWKKLRAMIISRDNGLCICCLREGIVSVADIVHHVVETKSDWSKRLDSSNLISVCTSCHNEIHKSK